MCSIDDRVKAALRKVVSGMSLEEILGDPLGFEDKVREESGVPFEILTIADENVALSLGAMRNRY